MSETILYQFGMAIGAGIFVQWLAWRIRFPSILLLLATGFTLGPITGVIDPEVMMGDALNPIISISVAIILFEGGLGLHWSEIVGTAGKVVGRLVTVGAIWAWLSTALIGYYLLEMQIGPSLLLGAVLVVTGPTVIGPLLKMVRPKGNIGPILRWEGIVIDPIGATLAVLVFEVITEVGSNSAVLISLWGLVKTILVGGIIGGGAAWIVIVFFRRYWISDYLRNPFVLALVIGVHVLSNFFQHESGLLTVTVMGIVLGNQRKVSVHNLLEFKESLQVIIIGVLFILLSARLDVSMDEILQPELYLFTGLLIVFVRPISVWIAAFGSDLKKNEKLYLSLMAPRGIVAAAVASVFALNLGQAGNESDASKLVVAVFATIVVTVAFYGLLSNPLARRLGLADTNPQGILFLGANAFALTLAKAVRQLGFSVHVVDTNAKNIEQAEEMNLPASFGNILSPQVSETLQLSGIGRLMALTENDQANSLASIRYAREFGRANVYQGYPTENAEELREDHDLRGRFLFGEGHTIQELLVKISSRWGRFRMEILNVENDTEDEREELIERVEAGKVVPLLLKTKNGALIPVTQTQKPDYTTASRFIVLVEYSLVDRIKDKVESITELY